MDEETIVRLRRNDPALTSLRSATFFVTSFPQHHRLFCGGGNTVMPVVLPCVNFICSVRENLIRDIQALGEALATNNTLTTLE